MTPEFVGEPDLPVFTGSLRKRKSPDAFYPYIQRNGTRRTDLERKDNKMKKLMAMIALGAGLAFAGAAGAAEIEIKMLNKGEKGAMVFEPDFVRAAPGDTVRFVPTDKSHNAEAIKGMVPEGAELFKGKINQEIVVTLDKEGIYGVKCAPHYGMGMVLLIEVGNAENADAAQAVKHPGKAKTVFAELFGQMTASR